LPSGTTNLDPILQGRTILNGVVNTQTDGLKTSLRLNLAESDNSVPSHTIRAAILASEATVQGDVSHFIRAKGIVPNLAPLTLTL
jgi:hypothetical protein